VEAVLVIYEAEDLEACILTSLPDRPHASQSPPGPPNTNTTTPVPGAVVAEPDWDVIEDRITGLLEVAQPQGDLTVGVVFTQPMSVAQVEELLANLDAVWISAWRSDYACLTVGVDALASRFAFPDGVQRAASARLAADAAGSAVTGRFLLEEIWEEMEEAAMALRAPGVMIEAVQAGIPVASLPQLAGSEAVRLTRLALDPESAGDLSQIVPPRDCISS
jgi:hypothetical protein